MTSVRAAAGKVLLFTATLVLALGALELALRAFGIGAPVVASPLGLPGLADAGEPFSRPDDLLIWSIVPGARTYPWYDIDRHGWRTPEFPDTPAPGTFRLVTTGDSTTFGLGVLEDQRWSSVLRRALAGLCGDVLPVEVINAGVPGYSVLQDRLQIERDLLALEPDLVLLLVTGGNDCTNVELSTDPEVIAERRSLAGRLSETHLARLLTGRRLSVDRQRPVVPATSPSARPRVPLPDVDAALAALADLLPGRLALGVFQSQMQRATQPGLDEVARHVVALAGERGIPLADARPAVEALLPFPLYVDTIHPTPLGHTLIARVALEMLLARDCLPLPDAREAWLSAWVRAQAGALPAEAAALRGPDAPPGFAALAALYADVAALDARLLAGDPILPESVRLWDPLHGSRCRARSAARRLLSEPGAAALAEIRAHVRPADPLLACFPDEGAFLAADPATRALGRALVVFGAELGLPPVRADVRRGEAARLPDADGALALLDAVLALDPADDEARDERAWRLRRSGRRDEARADFAVLAKGSGPIADFARGLLAFEAHDAATAQAALRAAIAGAPSHGMAHYLLGQLLLRDGRLDDAARELVLATLLLGPMQDVTEALAKIDAMRKAATAGAPAGPSAGAPAGTPAPAAPPR